MKLSERLKGLLDDDKYSQISHSRSHKGKRSQDNYEPPSLAALERGGEYTAKRNIPDAARVAVSEEEEDDLKRELLFKFDLLKQSYKNDDLIPDFSIHSDYRNMKKTYDTTVKKLSVNSNVETYKNWLIGGCMAIEYAMGGLLNFDMKGFTRQQVMNMGSYEKLLIELGEKTYVPEESNWPVEVRLVGVLLINAAMFIGGKMIAKKTGSDILGAMSNLNKPPVKKAKMKGPDIDLDDIPDF